MSSSSDVAKDPKTGKLMLFAPPQLSDAVKPQV